MNKLLDELLRTTPEELLSIVNILIDHIMDQHPFLNGKIGIKILPEFERETITFTNGTSTEIEKLLPDARPEKLIIILFGCEIGTIETIQTSHYYSCSHVKMWYVTEKEDCEMPNDLRKYHFPIFIMNYLKNKIYGLFRISKKMDILFSRLPD